MRINIDNFGREWQKEMEMFKTDTETDLCEFD